MMEVGMLGVIPDQENIEAKMLAEGRRKRRTKKYQYYGKPYKPKGGQHA